MTKLLCTLLFVGLCTGASTCAAQLGYLVPQLLPHAIQGKTTRMSSDADMSSFELATGTPDLFVENAKAAARRLEYQITAVNGSGTARFVVATKNTMNTGGFGGAAMTYIVVTLQLESDGRTIRITSQNQSNSGAGEPGSAKKVIEEFKENLLTLYAAK